MTVGFIGCGNIASAIIGGAVSSGYLLGSDIICFNPHVKKSEVLNEKYGVRVCENSKDVAMKSDILFLTVKPQMYGTVIDEIRDSVSHDVCIVDVAAGMSIDKVCKLFRFDIRVVRAMPNTPIMYSEGATAVVRGNNVPGPVFDYIKGIFAAGGSAETVDENMMDAVTAVSGSSPAFFMRFAREIINAGIKLGMEKEAAKSLAVQTMFGTAKMIAESPLSIDTLIQNVASPGGTTEAGLKFMDESDFDETTCGIINAAANRSAELAKK